MAKDEVLSGADLTRVASGGAPVVLCRAEEVALFAVPLPLRAHRQRMSAAPFAVEESLAEPLSRMHVALGPVLADGSYLVAAAGREKMATWSAAMAKAGLRRARLLPDVMIVPVPAEREAWRVLLWKGRAMVRRGDGTGFAAPDTVLPALWEGAGKPVLHVHGEAPPGWPLDAPSGPMPKGALRSVPRGFDLRQGAFAPDDSGGKRVRAAALVAASGLALHAGIAAYDTHALQGIAAERAGQVQARLAELSPGTPPGADPAVALARLSQPSGPVRRGVFLPLLAQASAALAPMGARISFDTLVFSKDADILALGVRADDIATLQAVETALLAAGLSATTGPTTTAAGSATARIEIRAGDGS